jgi:hypothetical protein
MLEQTNGANFYGINRNTQKKKFQFRDYVLWFPKGENMHLSNFKKR